MDKINVKSEIVILHFIDFCIEFEITCFCITKYLHNLIFNQWNYYVYSEGLMLGNNNGES